MLYFKNLRKIRGVEGLDNVGLGSYIKESFHNSIYT